MKIAITCPASLPATQFGGIMFLGTNIAKKLSDKGHTVTIYTTDLDFANNSHTFNKNLPKIQKIDNFFVKRTHVYFYKFLFYINPSMYFQMIYDDMDIIHAIGVRSFQSFIATLVCKKKKIPLIITDQGGLTTHPDLKNSSILKKFLIKIQEPLIRYVIKNSSAIIVPNEYEEEIFLNFCNKEKIFQVKNGINLDEMRNLTYSFREKYQIKEKYFLFLGRFHYVKGIDILLTALKNIIDDPIMTNAILVIMGVDFGYEKKMLSLIKNFNLSHKIKIVKNPSRDDVLAAYSESEFLVLPSRWELSPLTPLEGFAFKKTVISTRSHGIPSTLSDGINSILVENGDDKNLGEAILYLMKNNKIKEQLGKEGYMFVQNIANSDKMVSEIYHIYEKILDKTEK